MTKVDFLAMVFRKKTGCRQYIFHTLDELEKWTGRKPYKHELITVMVLQDDGRLGPKMLLHARDACAYVRNYTQPVMAGVVGIAGSEVEGLISAALEFELSGMCCGKVCFDNCYEVDTKNGVCVLYRLERQRGIAMMFNFVGALVRGPDDIDVFQFDVREVIQHYGISGAALAPVCKEPDRGWSLIEVAALVVLVVACHDENFAPTQIAINASDLAEEQAGKVAGCLF